MMGLLDILKSDDPAVKQGIMQFGLSLLGSKGGLANALGQAGMQGLQGSQQYKQQQFQRQLQQSQLEQMQRQKMMQGREDDLAALPGKFIVPPSAPGMDATGGMETALEAPNNQASPQGRMDLGGLSQALMAAPGGFAQGLGLQQALRKDDTPIKASAGDVFFDRTGKQLFAAPEKVEKPTSDIQEFQFAVARGEVPPGQGFTEWNRANKRAGATNIPINLGQKGFDNTLKLRSDFRSEPIYKAHGEVASAHAQISTALKQASPAGDMAGATKLMKILDPGSVVRESELGMAMAATGMLDRVTNYAQMVISGEKLNPNQRKDFQKLADALFAESEKHYNAKRAEYEGIAKRNELNVVDVVGAPRQPTGLPGIDAIDAELKRRGGK